VLLAEYVDEVIDQICSDFSRASGVEAEALRPILELNLGIALLALLREVECLQIQLDDAQTSQAQLRGKLQSLQETLDAYKVRMLPN
jgi:hypothetical protein